VGRRRLGTAQSLKQLLLQNRWRQSDGMRIPKALSHLCYWSCDRSSWMNPEEIQIQPNATKLIGQLTVQMDNDLKHTLKTTQDFFQCGRLFLIGWNMTLKHDREANPLFDDIYRLKTPGNCCLQSTHRNMIWFQTWNPSIYQMNKYLISWIQHYHLYCLRNPLTGENMA